MKKKLIKELEDKVKSLYTEVYNLKHKGEENKGMRCSINFIKFRNEFKSVRKQ